MRRGRTFVVLLWTLRTLISITEQYRPANQVDTEMGGLDHHALLSFLVIKFLWSFVKNDIYTSHPENDAEPKSEIITIISRRCSFFMSI